MTYYYIVTYKLKNTIGVKEKTFTRMTFALIFMDRMEDIVEWMSLTKIEDYIK